MAVIVATTATPVAELIRGIPERRGMALVVLCDAEAASVLRPVSALPVAEARGRVQLEPDHVFVIPPGWEGVFQRRELVTVQADVPQTPLDKLLRSLADAHGRQGIAVILEGRGNDGVLGIKRLKEAGSLTIAQAPADNDTAALRSLIATGMIELVAPLSQIAERLAALGSLPEDPGPLDEPTRGDDAGRKPEGGSDALQDILVLVRVRSGHDFAAYKRATLFRRMSRRMQVCQCTTIASYHQYLREHPGELSHLLRDFLVSVTNFFRDHDAFDVLADVVIPRLFSGKGSGDQVRVWSAGCATGEEAYSLAILLHEFAQKLSEPPDLQIFATDIDEHALAEARAGRYPSTINADVSPERLQQFFTPDGDQYRVSKELREIVLFSPHNVLRDPPFSRLDLVACRNLLIYLNRDAQNRVLNGFHFGLRPEGFLFLGSSESAENTTMFAGFDAKHRLFTPRPSTSRVASDSPVISGRWDRPIVALPPAPPIERPPVGQLHHLLVERYAPPSVLVNEDLDVVHLSEHAGQLLHVAGGEPSRQLLRLIHPALRLDLRTAIYAARQNEGGRDTRVVRFDDHGTPRAIEIRVRVVDQPELGPGALLVLFDELEPSTSSEAPKQNANVALEPVMRELEDELRSTREQLRTTIEQYETSLEELKASNEELQAINEELRSATEELETSKQELQSVNEELTTLNHELKLKIDEVSHANSDLQNLMTSTDVGVVFLDRALNIKRFTPRAQDLINMIPTDIGRPLTHLTHRLETDDLPELARSVLQTLRTVEIEVRSRDGRRYLARMLPYRSLEDRIDGVVLTFVEVSDLREAIDARQRFEAALNASKERLRFALRNTPMLVVSLDNELRTTWGYVLGTEIDDHEPGSSRFIEMLAPGHAERFADVGRQVLRDGSGQRIELDVTIDGEPRTYDFRIECTETGVSVVGFDITPSKLAEIALLEADRRKDEFLATLSHELRNPLTPLKVAIDVAKLAPLDRNQLEHSIRIMERQVTHLTQLVDDLLDLSRITQGKMEIDRVPVDPLQIVEAALEATRPLFQQREHQLTIELPEASCRVLGDQIRLTQVLTNLLHNATKYTPRGGHIALALAIDRPRNMLVIRVRDDGEGISQDLLPRIFEIFVQSRDAAGRSLGGLGIGLNLIRRLVELHGGSVFAASAGPGHGSEFTVELALHPRREDQQS